VTELHDSLASSATPDHGFYRRMARSGRLPILGRPLWTSTERYQGMVLVFRDVSEHRRTERTLRPRETERQIINDNAKFPIAHCDPQHHYLFVVGCDVSTPQSEKRRGPCTRL